MAKIFISYRRDDSAYPAQMIHKDLSRHFGIESVVLDVDTIPPGVNFREYLNRQVSECDILLAIIGDQWIDILNQRLNEPDDYVRIEIQAALERKIPVVPILVDKASVPSENNLPPALVRLSNRQAMEVRAGADLAFHRKRLIVSLDRLLAEEERKRKEAEAKRKAEEERKRKEAEAKRKAEEERKRKEAEAKRKAEEERKRKEAEAKRKAEEERKRKEAEAKRKAEEERRRKEAEAKRRAEEERRRKEAEAKRRAEEERRREEDEAKRRAEEERRRKEAEAKRTKKLRSDVAEKKPYIFREKGGKFLYLAVSLVLSVIFVLALNEKIDQAIFDSFFQIRGGLTEQSEIVIVGIDDDSIQNLQLRWPWPRRLHAELIKSLSANQARVIVFNILFDAYSTDPQDDRLFSNGIATHPNVILATARTLKEIWLDPETELMSADTQVGSTQILVDSDGTVRRARLNFAGRPSIGYLAAKSFEGRDHWPTIANQDQTFTINFLGPPGTINTVSYYQALEPSKFLPENTFKNKLVIVGLTSSVSSDPNRSPQFLTPFSHMSGIEIHANVAHNLLHRSYFRKVPPLWTQVVGLLLAVLCGLLFIKFTPAWNGALYALAGIAGLLLTYWLFTSITYYVPPASFLVAAGTFLLVSVFTHYYKISQSEKRTRMLLEQSEKRIRNILASQPAGIDAEIYPEATAATRKIKVFISYRRRAEDARYMAEILDFLSGLHKEDIEFWTDQELRIGDTWDRRIKENLSESDIALVLVSQAYLDSDYCINTEISSFLERKITIIPIMLSPCEWQGHAWLKERQFLPSGGETLTEHYQDVGKRQRMLLEIRTELRRHADRLRAGD